MHVYTPEDLYSGTSDEEMGLHIGMTQEALAFIAREIEENFYQIIDLEEDDRIRGVYEYLEERLNKMREEAEYGDDL